VAGSVVFHACRRLKVRIVAQMVTPSKAPKNAAAAASEIHARGEVYRAPGSSGRMTAQSVLQVYDPHPATGGAAEDHQPDHDVRPVSPLAVRQASDQQQEADRREMRPSTEAKTIMTTNRGRLGIRTPACQGRLEGPFRGHGSPDWGD
jgi:hypothetical protein